MGKGDKKTKRGKIVIGSHGVRRPRKKKTVLAASAPKPQTKVKTETKIKSETKPKVEKKVKVEVKETTKAKKTTKKKVDE